FLGTVLSAELISAAEQIYRVPLIQVCRNTASEGIEVIAIDGMSAGKKIAEVMLSQGFCRFGYMQGPETP
ncbi:LacI family transcriptional regulator, partial [Klebsiella pneumoniae subsp. pneumoniae]